MKKDSEKQIGDDIIKDLPIINSLAQIMVPQLANPKKIHEAPITTLAITSKKLIVTADKNWVVNICIQ